MDEINASKYPFDHENGNTIVPFSTLMGLVPMHIPNISDKKTSKSRNEPWIFRSTYPAYSPGGFTRAFGGHAYAQACIAASRTVKPGFIVHNMTGHFLLLGLTNIPFIYRVYIVRDGGGFVQRRVDVTQDPSAGPVFTAIISFKRSEQNVQERCMTADLENRFEKALKGKKIQDHSVAPGVDSPFWWEIEKVRGPDPFPGLEMHKVDMNPHNEPLKTLDRRQLQFYRVIGPVPSVKEDPNMHSAAHLYASDRNGLFPIPNFLEMGDSYSNIASLSHTVIFHDEADGIDLVDEKGNPKWFCIEGIIEHISHGRTLQNTKIWDVSTNKPVASSFQDGLVRLKPGMKQTAVGKDSLFRKLPGAVKSEKL